MDGASTVVQGEGTEDNRVSESDSDLLESLRERDSRQSLLAELGRAALSGEPVASVADRACRDAQRHLDADFFELLRLSESGAEFSPAGGHGWSEDYWNTPSFAVDSESPAGRSLTDHSMVRFDKLLTDDRFTRRSRLLEHGVASGICVPLGSPGRAWGVLGVYSRSERIFDKADLSFVESVGHFLGILLDREAKSRALAASNSRNQLAINAVPFLISFLDSNLVYRFCNRAYSEWFGIPESSIIGRPMHQVLGEAAVNSLRSPLERVLSGHPVTFERSVPYRDGGTRDVVAHYIPNREHGRIVGFFAIVRDVTQRKAREAQLAALNAELEQRVRDRTREFVELAENVPCLFACIDLNLRYRFVSKRYTEVFERPVESIIGAEVRSIIGEASFNRVKPRLLAAMSGETKRFEETYTFPGQAPQVLRVSYVPKYSAGEIKGIFVLADDITAERSLESAILAAQEREKERFGNDLHDSICQELGGIALLSKTLEKQLGMRNLPEAALARTLVEKVSETTRQTRRLASGLVPVQLDKLTLQEAVQQPLVQLQLLHPDVRFSLENPADYRPPPPDTATQLFLVIKEASNNSLKHGRPGGVRIRLANESDHQIVEIEDDGGGTPAMLERSLGLGLKSMKQRVRTLGGTFEALPSIRDTGLRIRVRIPPTPRTPVS